MRHLAISFIHGNKHLRVHSTHYHTFKPNSAYNIIKNSVISGDLTTHFSWHDPTATVNVHYVPFNYLKKKK